MHILIDARLYGLENTGIGRYLISLVEELIKIGKDHKFSILLRSEYFNELNFPENWNKVKADISHYSMEEQLRLPFLIRRIGADVVHFPHFNAPFFWRGKFVVTIHDLTMHSQGISATKLPIPLYLAKRIPYKMVFANAVKSSSKVIVPSYKVKKDLLSYYKIPGRKVKVVYQGFINKNSKSDLKMLPKYNLSSDYFLYVGDLHPHKNVNVAVDAISLLNKKRKKKVKLLIVSARSVFLERLKKHAADVGVEDCVRFLGYISDDHLMSLYMQSKALVYPSLAEGFGLPGIEAMNAGTLVIASNISVFNEVYKDCAFYFQPANSKSLAVTMEKVLRISKQKRISLIDKSRRFVEKYSWVKTASETLKVYEQAC